MRNLMRAALLAAVLLGGGSVLGAQVSLSIRIGPPPTPRVVRVMPRQPGGEYIWVPGYWYPVGRRYKWVNGYWTRPPYPEAHWVEPRYEGGEYFLGFWDGPHGRFEHDHKWDKDRNHDADRWHGDQGDQGRGRGRDRH
jgi:WXXGXW repeat (2 copies)